MYIGMVLLKLPRIMRYRGIHIRGSACISKIKVRHIGKFGRKYVIHTHIYIYIHKYIHKFVCLGRNFLEVSKYVIRSYQLKCKITLQQEISLNISTHYPAANLRWHITILFSASLHKLNLKMLGNLYAVLGSISAFHAVSLILYVSLRATVFSLYSAYCSTS
jgi:hypothetical protein